MISHLFAAVRYDIEDGIHRHLIHRQDRPLSFAEAIHLWIEDEAFREFFICLLMDSPFASFRWETPGVNCENVNRDFEFVLIDSPEIQSPPDPAPFQKYISSADQASIVVFDNLAGDALLIVPVPVVDYHHYSHLAAFIRSAPAEQTHELWQEVGKSALKRLSLKTLWLSTAGGGVAWLHVRLDSTPKYYRYSQYRSPS